MKQDYFEIDRVIEDLANRLYQFFIQIMYNQKSLRNMQKVDYEKQSTVLIVEIAKK
jgi:hypothetical protein